jgi:hypothetical protein
MLILRQKLVCDESLRALTTNSLAHSIKNETIMAGMLQEQSSDECRCACHRAGAVVMHVLECCRRCPKCARSIVTSRYAAHVADCRAGGGMRERDVTAPPPP